MTFKELKDMIEKSKTLKPRNMLQIYSNRRQVNVLNSDGMSIGNIVFNSADEVACYRCSRPGYADYGHPLYMSIETTVPAWMHPGIIQEAFA